MAENDAAVYDLGNAYIYFNDVGAVDPTVAEIEAFDAANFGSEQQTVTITGSPTGGTFTLTFNGQTTSAIPYNATAAQVQTAVAALSTVGANNVSATGGPLPGTAVVLTWTNELAGVAQALITASAAGLTGGSSPAVAVTRTKVALGWTSGGHTSLENDFAPFYEGGEATNRGSRQNANLRTQVATASEGLDISFIQVDNFILRAFYGGGQADEAGKFTLPTSSTPIEKAVLIVYLDGEKVAAEMHPKASVFRNGTVRNAKGGWLEFPVRMTWLSLTGRDPSWYGDQILDETA